MQASAKHIAIYGGSFDPVHNGHVAICKHVAARSDIDSVLVVPCAQHAFGKTLRPFAERMQMCMLALATLPNVSVSSLEAEREGPSYMADTVRALQMEHPVATLSLVVGSDVAHELEHWHDIAWLREQCAILEVPRGPESPIPNVSSTEIRARCARGQPIHKLVPPVIAQYLETLPEMKSTAK